jgi:hypothetical protein
MNSSIDTRVPKPKDQLSFPVALLIKVIAAIIAVALVVLVMYLTR